MIAIADWAPEDPRPTFSIYMPVPRSGRSFQIVGAAADLVGAVTIAGPKGPEVMRRQRDMGLKCAVLFDGLGYADRDVPAPADWVAVQLAAGADRSLLPGVFLDWDRNDNSAFLLAVGEQSRIAQDLGAIPLFAIDVRWIARKSEVVIEALLSANQPVALVLVHRGDPLSDFKGPEKPKAQLTGWVFS